MVKVAQGKIILVYLIILLTFFIAPQEIYAQLKLGRFYASGKPDWVEIINETDSEVNFSEYLITDIAGNNLQKDIFIPPNGNCILDFHNRLNNGGDIIFLKKSDAQIDCVKYGEPESGECSNTRSPEGSEVMPSSSCFEKKATPAPTVILTPPPTPMRTQIPTPVPVSKASPDTSQQQVEKQVLAEISTPSPTPTEEVIIIGGGDNDYIPIASMFGGVSISIGSIAWVFKKEYNERHPST